MSSVEMVYKQEERSEFLERLSVVGFEFRKSLGQNFLYADRHLRRIVEVSGLQEGDQVLELGAGAGTLTAYLAQRVGQKGQVYSVEIDERLRPVLEAYLSPYPQVKLQMSDARALKLSTLMKPSQPHRVVANLPYYITTELMCSLLLAYPEAASFTFLVDEAALRRIFAKVNDAKAYGPLSILYEVYGLGKVVFRLPGEAFVPKPKVASACVHFKKAELTAQTDGEEERLRAFLMGRLADFYEFLQVSFQQRRKTILNNLKERYSSEAIQQLLFKLPVLEGKRAEALPWGILGESFYFLSDMHK